MGHDLKEEGKFKYIESGGDGDPLVLLHGLLGGLSNFSGIINYFSKDYNVVVPILPIFDLPIRKISLTSLVEHIRDFVEYKGYESIHVLGNSLGGHIALLYVLAHPGGISSLILTGSSGLFENSLGSSFPKRGNYEFIKKKTEDTFFDPEIATKELVDEVYEVVNDRNKAIRVIATAKSAIRHNIGDKLHQIKAPTLLVWGDHDAITPTFVGEKFNELIEGSQLVFVDRCGHAPMMERPMTFNKILEKFLKGLEVKNIL